MSARPPVALTVAGSDSGGGAGIEMDLKVFSALDVFGTCAITALTAQNTAGVREAWECPADFVAAQINAVLDDMPVAAVKTGMLSSEEVVRRVAAIVDDRGLPNLVVDPVVVAKDGTHLLTASGLEALRRELLPRALIVTPNIPEAEALTQASISSQEDARRAAAKLRGLGCKWVLLKGGHQSGATVTDLLIGSEGEWEMSSPRVPGGPFHGTGCALSAAVAAYLARGIALPQSAREGRDFVQRLLQDPHQLGKGVRVLHPQSQVAPQKRHES